MNVIKAVEASEMKKGIPEFTPGDLVKVAVKVKEGDKERIQVFQGVVTAIKGGGARRTFTVRKVSEGIGVERIFPVNSPNLGKIEVLSRGKTRRAKLYYLRKRQGKAARIKTARERQEAPAEVEA
jgi:large subunit ribosomal protein L19